MGLFNICLDEEMNKLILEEKVINNDIAEAKSIYSDLHIDPNFCQKLSEEFIKSFSGKIDWSNIKIGRINKEFDFTFEIIKNKSIPEEISEEPQPCCICKSYDEYNSKTNNKWYCYKHCSY